MVNFFKNLFKNKETAYQPISFQNVLVDMHSHILPGLDDGADNLEKSLELVQEMISFGYKKLIMTPHIMGDFYRNTPEGIFEKLSDLKQAVNEKGLEIELDCAAEYYLDESLLEKLNANEKLLTFGKSFLLFETSYINEPLSLSEAIFSMMSSGYTPVLAHPERYTYLYGRFDDLKKLHEKGVLFQINLNSLTGYYSDAAKRVAEKLIDAGMVDFVGSDVHSTKHVSAMQKLSNFAYFRKVLELPLLNKNL